MKFLRQSCLVCALATVLAASANGGTLRTWKTTVSGNWNTASSWVGGVLPVAGDSALIPSGSGSPTANADLGLVDVQVDSATLKISNSLATTGSITLNGGTMYMNNSYSVTPPIRLMANSTIATNVGYANNTETVAGSITELTQGLKLTFDGEPHLSGSYVDSLAVSSSNSYTGGTEVYGPKVVLNNAGALGTGPVNINSGFVLLNAASPYRFGKVTTHGSWTISTSGSSGLPWGAGVLQLTSGKDPKNLNVDMQGGVLMSAAGNGSVTVDNTNTITISGTAGFMASGGGYINNTLNLNTTVTGAGKAVLEDWGTPYYTTVWNTPNPNHMTIGAPQSWTGGTDVKGLADINVGGSLPAGTVTVYGVDNAKGYTGTSKGELRLFNSTAGANGGLDPATDLVLVDQTWTSGTNTLVGYASLNLGNGVSNVVVHTLTINGVVKPAGFYKAADLPNNLITYNSAYTIRVMTPDAGPAAITNLAGTSPDWFKVTLTWTAPADNIDPIVSSYDIRYSTATIDSSNWASATRVTGGPTPVAPGQAQTFTISGLLGGTTYYFAVKSADAGGNWSDLSNIAPVSTLATDSVPPAAVSNLAITDIRPSRMTLTWTATGDDGMTGTATSYDLRYSTTPIVSDADFAAATPVAGLAAPKAPGGAEAATVTGLTPSTTYYFAIKVKDEAANSSALSNVPSAPTKDIDLDPPLAVADLRIVNLAAASVTLAWTAPADQGTAGTGSYDLRYSTSPITNNSEFAAATGVANLPAPAAAGTGEQFAIGNLQSSTVYYFALKTADLADPANISAMSNIVSGMTRPPVVPVVVHNPWLSNDRLADTHNLNTMAATYVNAYTPDGVVLPTSNQDKAINIYNNQKRRLYHWADEPPSVGGNDINDPTYNQNVFGWGLCGRHASQGCTIANAIGFGQRKISVPGDWQMEFFYDGNWHLFHTMMTFYIFNRATPPYIPSAADIKADNSLVLNAAADGRACPGFLLCGDTASGEATMVNSWGDGGSGVVTTRWTGNMDLRLGQAFARTWQAWQNQHPTPSTDADSGNIPGPDAPYHHECQNDWKDYVNFPYWEPYGQVIPYIHTSKTTYRRWSNGTDTLAPDFRSAGYQALLESSSNNIATFFEDGIAPDLHGKTINTQGEAVFKINVPFYITDANFSGTFVKATASDVCKVYISTNGTSWTQVYDAPVGTTVVTNQPLRTNVFGLWTTWYIKVQLKGAAAKANAGVSNFVVTTTFEHNKGSMAYLDKGTNNLTLTFDNAAELQASGNVVHVVYHWKENSGTGWTTDKQYEGYFAASPSNFTIVTGGTKVPRTESIVMEVIPLPYDPVAPGQVTGLTAGTAKSRSVPLTWTATGDDGATGTAMAYDLRYSTSPITDDASFNAATQVAGVPAPKAAGSVENFTVMYLPSNTTCYFAVKAIDKGGNRGPISDVVTATTTAPAPVTDLAAGVPTSAKVALSWTAIDDGSTGTCASYNLRYSTNPITDDTTFNAATAATGVPAPKAAGQAESFAVTYLNPSTTYYFAIKGIDAKGNSSPLSNIATATTAAAPAVSDLAVGSPGSSRMPLTWTAIDDGVTGKFTSYNLRYSTTPITDDASFSAATAVAGVPAPKAAGQAEGFAVTGLSGNTTYYFAIKAIDAQGRSSLLSNVVFATTIVDTVRPQWVGNLKGQPSHTAKAVDLTWSAPSDYVDGGAGPYTCATYYLRYSTSPITDDATFAAATAITGLPAPKAPGQAESVTVVVPTGGATYYFAIKVGDDANPANISEVSNCAKAVSSANGDMVLQQGLNGYTGCMDTYIDQGSNNYAGNSRMTVCGFGPGNYQRGMVRFDLTSLVGMNITSANLWLYAYNQSQCAGSTGFYGVYPFSHSWVDSGANWSNSASGTPWSTPGGDFDSTPDATAAKQAKATVPCWYSWDVTARVQSWLAGTSTNYGWIIKCTDESFSNQDQFYQKEVNNNFAPKLLISDLQPRKIADIDGDNAVNVADLLALVSAWAKTPTVRGYEPWADINSDGYVNVGDLQLLVVHWGE